MATPMSPTAPTPAAAGRSPDPGALRFKEGATEALTLSWGTSWRLEHIKSGRSELFPPGNGLYFDPEATLKRPLVVLAEEGSGFTSFRNWIRRRVGPEYFIEIDLENAPGSGVEPVESFVARELVDALPASDSGEASNESEGASVVPVRRQDNDVVSLIRDHFLGAKPRRLLCMLHIERVPRRSGGRLLSQLRGAIEDTHPGRTLDGVQFLMLGRDESAFDIEPYSAFLPVVDTCRLPRFTPAEIRSLLDRLPDAALQSGGELEVEHLIHERTGGQPLLTQLLLEALVKTSGPNTTARLRRAYQSVRDRPPIALHAWQARLARMIQSNASTHDIARALARGAEYPRGAAPFVSRSLSIAGWMSPGFSGSQHDPVWRFSELHRHWARAVFRNPTRFLDQEGGRP